MSKQGARINRDQVYALNEKYGYFEFGDAQGDVSLAFANDAVALHERVRSSAPELLEALEETDKDLTVLMGNIGDAAKRDPKWEGMYEVVSAWRSRNRAVIAKATGESV